MDDDILRLPPVNVRLGSCPECGKPIWDSDKIHNESASLKAVYRCVECKRLMLKDDIIPF